MILKQVIRYPETNSVEATWIERTVTPAVGVEGEEGYQPEQVTEVQVRCHSYADVQMDMLEADLGADAAQYAELIATVRANIKPDDSPPPSPQDQIAALEAQQLLPRVTREFMLASFEAQAAAKGLTIANLTTPTDPNYAPGFAKLYAFDQQIVAWRGQIK